MSNFNIGDNVALIDNGHNVYKIVDIEQGYYLLNCIDWECSEWLSYDVSCFQHNSELWIHADDMWQFEHVYLTNFDY